jgi:hypothetical protein
MLVRLVLLPLMLDLLYLEPRWSPSLQKAPSTPLALALAAYY